MALGTSHKSSSPFKPRFHSSAGQLPVLYVREEPREILQMPEAFEDEGHLGDFMPLDVVNQATVQIYSVVDPTPRECTLYHRLQLGG